MGRSYVWDLWGSLQEIIWVKLWNLWKTFHFGKFNLWDVDVWNSPVLGELNLGETCLWNLDSGVLVMGGLDGVLDWERRGGETKVAVRKRLSTLIQY